MIFVSRLLLECNQAHVLTFSGTWSQHTGAYKKEILHDVVCLEKTPERNHNGD